MRKFRTIRRQPESARWRREYIDKLSGDPFNPKPKTSMAVGPGELPFDLQWSTRASPNVNVDEAPADRAPEPSATQKRWYVTEALVNEHGRTMGCPRCSSGIGIHNAECRARIEGILLQQSRMKPAEVDEPRGGHTTTKSAPMELEKPTGPVHHGGSSGSGIQRDDATRTGATRNADARPLEATDVEMMGWWFVGWLGRGLHHTSLHAPRADAQAQRPEPFPFASFSLETCLFILF